MRRGVWVYASTVPSTTCLHGSIGANPPYHILLMGREARLLGVAQVAMIPSKQVWWTNLLEVADPVLGLIPYVLDVTKTAKRTIAGMERSCPCEFIVQKGRTVDSK
ncbi:unnamed protein product [Pieris macdunnoughi]|uniref:Uncharacterized protein n=1 Tax=Pieris macdunnoughi TaxID=345717 RepID=A0A821W6Y2_9NEOP|nr:unnamed protein product [Pieris macdunnoughi]